MLAIRKRGGRPNLHETAGSSDPKREVTILPVLEVDCKAPDIREDLAANHK
jgi:hypothetical protein